MERSLLNFDISKLQESQQDIIECIGIESYYKLAKRFGGGTLYIARVDKIDKKQRNKMIINEYKNGATYRELAVKYNLTAIWIRNIVDGKV